MINIDLSKKTQTLFVPIADEAAEVLLTFENTTDGTVVSTPVIGGTWKRYGLLLDTALPADLYPGEWKYGVRVMGELVSAGLAIVKDGDNPDGVVEYATPTTCKQYGE